MSVLGVDIGTSGTKGLVLDMDGRVIASAAHSYPKQSPHPGWYEIDPALLLSAVETVIAEAAGAARQDPVEAISFSVFGGSFVALDHDFRPSCNLICTTDSRANEDARRWSDTFGAERTYQITGVIPHPSLLLLKAMMFRRLYPDLFSRCAKLVSAEELVFASLGLPPVADRSTASTYMACEIATAKWSPEILEAAGIAHTLLPEIVACGSVVGALPAATAGRLGLRNGVTVVAGGHDQQMASFGAGLVRLGEATVSLGTVEAIGTAKDTPGLDRGFFDANIPTWRHVTEGQFYSLVYSFSCGDLLNWASRAFWGAQPGHELAPLKQALSSVQQRPARALVLPHLSGSGTPHMDPLSRGAIVGLDLASTREEILRAILDSQNYEMRLNLDIWADLGIAVNKLRAFGGLAQSDAVLQVKADVLGVEVARLDCTEAGCFGAAVLAATGAGLVDNSAAFIRRHVRELRSFQPRTEFAQQHAHMYGVYRSLYESLKSTNHRLAMPDTARAR